MSYYKTTCTCNVLFSVCDHQDCSQCQWKKLWVSSYQTQSNGRWVCVSEISNQCCGVFRVNNWYVILVSYNKTCTYACLPTYISTAEIKKRFTVWCTALSREFVLLQIPVEVYKVHSILIFIFYYSMISISPLSIISCIYCVNKQLWRNSLVLFHTRDKRMLLYSTICSWSVGRC